VLLLDEPTNHLDFTSIQWLEGLLRDFRGSVLFITHDRSFLDNVATRIVELDRGRCCHTRAISPAYQVRKAEQLAIEEIENAKFDKFLAQEEVWIRKGVQARRTRDEGRVRRLERLREQRAVRRDQQGQVQARGDLRRAFRQDRRRTGKRQQVPSARQSSCATSARRFCAATRSA
jgi:ATP-binding cassette subfamily F protein uup